MQATQGWVFVVAVGLGALGCAPDHGVIDPDRSQQIRTHLGGDSQIVTAIDEAADATGVPAALIASLAYGETRFRHRDVQGSPLEHDGHHAHARRGLFGLTDAELALTGATSANSISSHAYAVAELLATKAGPSLPTTLAGWHPVLAAWRGEVSADAVMASLARGLRGTDIDGNRITLTATVGLEHFAGDGGSPLGRQGLPDAIWNSAHSSNYANASRSAASINYIVVHTIQGSYGSAINWFKDPAANVSSHYVVKSSNGEVTQMVDDSDRAWHDRCFNSETIGIEHEGYVSDPELWYTESMYMASARLAAHAAREYNIPIDRQHFFGHGDAPDCSDHTDPGPGWDWDHYMALVAADGEASLGASFVDVEWPSQMVSGEDAVVYFEFENLSNMTWGLDETRLGTAEPQDRESPFFVEGNWLSTTRATGADHSNYSPGKTGRFTFAIVAPEVDEPTTFTETFQLVQEGVAWFGPTATANVTVVPRGWTGSTGDDDIDDDQTGEGDDENLDGGGCSAASQSSGLGGGACAIVLACALLGLRRRRRRVSVRH